MFTILTFSHNVDFYLQHVLKFIYNTHVYTLVILPSLNFGLTDTYCYVYGVETRSDGQ
jgi:uncharacterized protein (DUF1919 family)